ncbi:MAG: hypothetical protein IKO26_11775 [Paludibacteraceae bacterium]|nr:hypothetical protein [Paludibacteraceae bacterium]
MKERNSIKSLLWRLLGVNYLSRRQELLEERQKDVIRNQNELLWANKFHDSIIGSEWFRFQTLSPGGWAVDYGFLYSLYRILDVMRPTNILEFGLGQSSKLVHQYATHYAKSAMTIEQSQNWIEHFSKEINGKYDLQVKNLNVIPTSFNGFPTTTYENLHSVVSDSKYDLILVDGPIGTEHFSRSHIMDLVQHNLANSFCIIIDDYERFGEQETVSEVKKVLDSISVDYSMTVRSASKDHCIICSSDNCHLLTI